MALFLYTSSARAYLVQYTDTTAEVFAQTANKQIKSRIHDLPLKLEGQMTLTLVSCRVSPVISFSHRKTYDIMCLSL